MATKKWTLTKPALVARLTPATRSSISVRSNGSRELGCVTEKPSRNQPYWGPFLPGEFPAALEKPVTQALNRRQGATVKELLLRDEGGYLWHAWARRNSSLLADSLPAAFAVPVRTLVRMIDAGEVGTVPDLQVRIEQVLAINARKYSTRSFKKWTPKLGHGRPQSNAGKPAERPNLFVSGVPVPVEKADKRRPDEAAAGEELVAILERTRGTLDPRELQIFETVQAYRVRHGVKGAYPAAVRTLVTDGRGNPLPEGGQAFVAAVRSVRRIFLKVQAAFATRVIAGGYSVPLDRKPQEKSKPDAQPPRQNAPQ